MSRQDDCIAAVQRLEGVGVIPGNPWGDVHDDGGDTRAGVTQAVFSKWLLLHGQPDRSVFTATGEEIAAIYGNYWADCAANQLPAPLDLAHFAFAFNTSPPIDERQYATEAGKILQRALKVPDDGIIGPVTLGAAASFTPTASAFADLQCQWAFYSVLEVENPAKYGGYMRSWQWRLQHVADLCGVPDPTTGGTP